MIFGIGTDIVSVQRMTSWTAFSDERLLKVFTKTELADCRDGGAFLLSEKLAVRFAAKEAFYKALSAALVSTNQTMQTFPLLSICPHVYVVKETWGVPQLCVDWDFFKQRFGVSFATIKVHLSLAHEKENALAFVIISSC